MLTKHQTDLLLKQLTDIWNAEMTRNEFCIAFALTNMRPGTKLARALELVLVDGKTVQEAARIIGVAPGNLYRARAAVKSAAQRCPRCGQPISR